ncbi:hypothetical protein O0L34_g12232 [Tuta absoluta]|nr:hypothetical protein O0L34_g12232 [Tuta absoluta]
MARRLIGECGASVTSTDTEVRQPHRLAALGGHLETVRALFQAPCTLDNRLAMARRLIGECGASVTSTDTEVRQPHRLAALGGHLETVRALFQAPCTLDNRLAMARRLIGECGASVTSTDTEVR